MRGVFSVGGRDSLMVMRKTVMERSAEIPRVTFTITKTENGFTLKFKVKIYL